MNSRILYCAVFASLVVLANFLCTVEVVESRKHLNRLPRLNIAKQSFGVSGLSAGAFMAVQFQVAFSKSICGAGVIAGGPFFVSSVEVMHVLLKQHTTQLLGWNEWMLSKRFVVLLR